MMIIIKGDTMKKEKKNKELKFKDYLGTTLMSTADVTASTVMTSLFMLYLTDYAGIGKWGAILGSALLLFARVFDAVNDPLEAYIMDSAKVGKHGKYRPFLFLSVLMTTIGIIGLFFLPGGLRNSPALICIWVIFFYLLYDIGASFFKPILMYRSMTLDSDARGSLLIGPRILSMLIGMVGAALIKIIETVNGSFNNMHTSFGVTISGFIFIAGVIAVSGLLMIREKYIAEDNEESVRLTDIIWMLKNNKALRITASAMLFSGFIWTFLFATSTYYIKWAYCVDLATGAVDTAKLGTLMLGASMLMFIPLIIGTVIASPLMKRFHSPMNFHKFLIACQAIPCLLMFVLQILGILKTSPILFFLCMGIAAFAIGIDFIPSSTVDMEVMDYEIYLHEKDRSALCDATNKFINKLQSAFSSAFVGVILIAIGYEVDSVTDTFLGELSAIPTMNTWFIVIMGLIPGILAVICWMILKHYPIDDQIRLDMKEKLNKE